MPNTYSQQESVTSSARLDELVAEMSARVAAGESVDLATLTADCPELREQLEMLLPTLQAVVDLEQSLGVGKSQTQPHTAATFETLRGVLGDFRIIREIGRGGMGVVYEAEQISLGRHVALKVLPLAATLNTVQLQRFNNEARAAAALKHSNIVGVYSVGVERGVHYYAMELVAGCSLAEVVEWMRAKSEQDGAGSKAKETSEVSGVGCQVPVVVTGDTAAVAALSTLKTTQPAEFFRSIARLGVQAADVLDYAHQMGIVHRDVKPSNILVAAGGQLWITDFGLAMTQTDAGLTMTGDLLGTLRYMSPEQAAGKRLPLDHRTDVYSLGITLYELLAGRPAFNSSDRAELLRAIAEVEPPPLRKLVPTIPADLETVVHKAIEKDATDRYTSAAELSADLRHYLENRPITARPPSLATRTRKWVRRHSTAVAAAAGVLCLAVVSLLVGALMLNSAYRHSAERERQAEKNLDIAVDTIDRLLARVAADVDVHGQLRHAEQLYVDAADAYDRVLENTNDPEFVLKAASSRARLAEVFDEAGRHDRALQETERGLRLLHTLSAAANVREREMEVRAELLNLQGWAHLHLDDFSAAEWSLSEAVHLHEQLVESAGNKLDHRRSLWGVVNDLAVLHMETDQLDESERLFRRARSIREAMPNEDREDGESLHDEAAFTGNLASIDRDRGNYAGAEKGYREAIELMRRAIVFRPDFQDYRNDLYNSRWNLADTFVRAGRHQDAAEEVDSITQEFPERLQTHIEGVWLLMQCIAIVKSNAQSQAGTDGKSIAERYRDQAHETHARIQAATFAPPAMQLELAWLLATCPDRKLRDGERAVQIVRRLMAAKYQSYRLPHTLSAAYLAAGSFDQAYQAIQSSLQSRPSGSAHQFILLALAEAGRGELEEARHWYAKALAADKDVNPRERLQVKHFCLGALFADAESKLGINQPASESSITGDK